MPRQKSKAAIRVINASVHSNLLAAAKRKKWREENTEAIRAYNEHVEKHGTFSDDMRCF